MQSEEIKHFQEISVQEIDSAFELLSSLNHLLALLWDHYESGFLDKLRERNLPPSEPDPIELPF